MSENTNELCPFKSSKINYQTNTITYTRNSFIQDIETDVKTSINHKIKELRKLYKSLNKQNKKLSKKTKHLDKKNNDILYKLNVMNYEKDNILQEKLTKINDESIMYENNMETSFIRNEEFKEFFKIINNKITGLEEKVVKDEKKEKIIEYIDTKMNEMGMNIRDIHERVTHREDMNTSRVRLDETLNLPTDSTHVDNTNRYNSEYTHTQNVNSDREQMKNYNEILERNTQLESMIKGQDEALFQINNSKETYKRAFLEAEKLFKKYVKDKDLRDLMKLKKF